LETHVVLKLHDLNILFDVKNMCVLIV